MRALLPLFAFRNNDSNVPAIMRCVTEAVASIMEKGDWIHQTWKGPDDLQPVMLLFTDDLVPFEDEAWISDPMPGIDNPLRFFLSHDAEARAVAKARDYIVLTDGLDHLPRQIAAAIEARFELLRRLPDVSPAPVAA
ncbi:MAG: hypothetical protein V4481_04690 [Patescibacteria group bacterium]